MKKRVVLSLSLLLILTITLASASDVAYLYKNSVKIDDNIIQTFNDLGLTVDLIQEKSQPSNYNNYKLLYIGDENFRTVLPVNDYPVIISSYHDSDDYGITDRDGVSKLGATSPLSVLTNSEPIQVYTIAFELTRIAIPYYYLDKDNKAQAMQQIAATQTTSSGYKFGDVISYAPAGSQLSNGKTQQGNLCFFGITKTKYWTPEAKVLFKECAGFVAGSVSPTPEPEPECSNETDCPDTELSDPFCQDNNLMQTQTIHFCINNTCIPNTTDILLETCDYDCYEGQCTDYEPIPECTQDTDCPESTTSEPFCRDNEIYETTTIYTCECNECIPILIDYQLEICDYGCENAQCLPEPEPEPTENHDIALIDFTNAVNNIRIKDSEYNIISGNELQCNEKYKFEIKVENTGDFTEDVSFLGSIGSLELNHNSISSFAPTDTPKLKAKTINSLSLSEGSYNITIQAIIDGFIDINPTDNTATRQIYISC